MKQLNTFPVAELLTETQPFISISIDLDANSGYSEKDSLTLENFLKEAQQLVADLGSQWKEQIEEVRSAQRQLISATSSLLIYITENETYYYYIESPVKDHMIFGQGPDLTPLIKHYQFKSDYHLLVLNQDSAHIYDLSSQKLEEVTEGHWPLGLTSVLGEEKDGGQLNHTGSAGPGQVGMHGHNETSVEKEIDRENFFRSVDNQLIEDFGQESERPLILYSLTENQAAYRAISKYQPLLDEGIELSAAKVSTDEIAEQAYQFVNSYRGASLASLSKRFIETKPEFRVTDQLEEIQTLAQENRIDELILVEDKLDDLVTNVDKKAVVKDIVSATYKAKGTVYILTSDQLQGDFTISARLRY